MTKSASCEVASAGDSKCLYGAAGYTSLLPVTSCMEHARSNSACASEIPDDSSDDMAVSLLQTSVQVTDKVRAAADANNLCIDGRLAPEFMLLGPPKAGTTTYFEMFITKGVVLPDTRLIPKFPNTGFKELWFFDQDFEEGEKGKQHWLSYYTKCVANKRMVAVDFSPGYLCSPAAPQRILQFYGETLASRIQFSVLLRKPLDRMHSHFYHIQRHAVLYQYAQPCAGSIYNSSFQNYMQITIQGEDPCKIFDMSSYGKQLAQYFKFFAPSQFTIIPFREFVAPNQSSFIIMEQWRRLGLTGVSPPATHSNAPDNHPTLEQDLDPQTLQASQEYISKNIGAQTVANVLSVAHPKPILEGFVGDPTDANSITSWLDTKW